MKRSRDDRIPAEGAEMVTMTDAARNFADLVNRVFYKGARFVLTRGGRPMAVLSPPRSPMRSTAADIRLALKRMPRLGYEEAESMRRDIEDMRRAAGRPSERPWE